MHGERLLVVDDESGVRRSLADILADENWEVDIAGSGEEALAALKRHAYRAIFLDVWLPGIDGIETLRLIRRAGVDAPVVMISGHGTIETAVRATKLGAFDFIEKPLSLEKILLTLRNALRQTKLEQQSRVLMEQFRRDTELVGGSPAIQRLREEIERAAPTAATVLIRGEHGTGKELAARLLHARSQRSGEAFVAVNCAAIPEDLIESEMFGHVKGAFTGATEGHKGKFELAHEGTLFLDEIADMSPLTQAKLLRVLERGEITPVGGTASSSVDVRLLAATNRDLAREMAAGRFREDLFFRLNVVPLDVPPLRERREDILLLAEHFITRFCREYGRPPMVLSPGAKESLMAHLWPGNVRELKNLIERLAIMAPGREISQEQLPAPFGAASRQPHDPSPGETLRRARENFEREFILRRLEENNWNISRTADALGLERSNLYRKMKAYGLKSEVPAGRSEVRRLRE
ncbi:MAG: Fis family transcriptional regulator [Acidobacteria bacterium]|nr:MAG: Fis family transcriptional regulator [Acidobacteriota bacterium]